MSIASINRDIFRQTRFSTRSAEGWPVPGWHFFCPARQIRSASSTSTPALAQAHAGIETKIRIDEVDIENKFSTLLPRAAAYANKCPGNITTLS
jgi:hypothetical protein